MELEVLKKDGSNTGAKVKLPPHVFAQEPNHHAVYLAVKAQNANSRQGTASSKTRSMVRGGGKKPFKQKGRGAARAGTNNSPLWVGGGRVFGPHPRDYGLNISKKVKTLARLSVFSDRAKNKKITVVEDFKIESQRTKEMFSILKALGLGTEKTLLLLPDYDSTVVRASKNLQKLNIRVATSESTYDLLNCERLLIQQSALKKLSEAFKK